MTLYHFNRIPNWYLLGWAVILLCLCCVFSLNLFNRRTSISLLVVTAWFFDSREMLLLLIHCVS